MTLPTASVPGSARFGEWRSPLSAAEVAEAGLRLTWVQLTDDAVWWSEIRPTEARAAICRRGADGAVSDAVPFRFDTRTRAHEYGGHAWLVLPSGAVVCANRPDERIWRVDRPDAQPRPLTPAPSGPRSARYADFALEPGGAALVCVRETLDGHRARHDLVRVPVDGSAADGELQVLWAGADFVMALTFSPDGRRLAWMAWDHPEMPWDATRLMVADVDPRAPGQLAEPRTVAGGDRREAVQQPQWGPDGTLYAITDRTGWWNLHRFDGSDWHNVAPMAEECGQPLWVFGIRTYGLLGGSLAGKAVLAHGSADYRLDVVDLASGDVTPLDLPYREAVEALSVCGTRVAFVGASPTTAGEVVVLDVATGSREVVKAVAGPSVDPAHLPEPRHVTVPAEGRTVHAQLYPPRSPEHPAAAAAADGERPPFVVFSHGGPTGQASVALDLTKAYFTSRGIGVIDVDYGGSSGYGRDYRELLRGQWGVVDVEDCVAVARWLVDEGLADPARLAIRGGSAGGWTTLACLTRTDAFAAGASYFGVADAKALAEETHEFESRYLDSIIGPLPEAEAVYAERSPLSHVDELSCPVLLLQGLDDKVVPPAQAEQFVAALERKGIPYGYVTFPGEGHGFVSAAARTRALEAELSFYGQVLGFAPPDVPEIELRRPSA